MKVFNRDIFATGLHLGDQKTVTAVAGAATKNGRQVIVTSEALVTAAGATYTLTLTNAAVSASSIVLATVGYGTSTAGTPCVTRITPAAGSVAIVIQNIHAANALNGTIKIRVIVIDNK